jgi:hypothetical protein
VGGLYDGNVRFSWTAPDSNYDTILSYDLEIFNAVFDSSIKEETYCSGNDPAILDCIVPTDVLTAAPYNLVYD